MVARDLEDLSGQQIGNYEIESHIAARKASDLFLARDVKLERLVFLEVLRVTEFENEDLAARFRRRMETVSQLKDRNIAVVSDIDVTEDGFPYAVIDYFPGETLAAKLAAQRQEFETLPVIESLELTKQIAQGLGVAHEAGLIHHDLRPENIMLRQDGTPILIDLGVPLVAGESPSLLNSQDDDGMLDYAAPEETDGKALTRRSNIYSLGVILYELLSGHRPNLPNLPFDIFPQANMPKEEPLEEARPGLAGETYRLVRNCLWRQEWSRFETADEMITAIETAIFAEQELPKATAWSPQRGRSLVLFAIPIVLVLLGVLGFFLLRSLLGGGGDENPPADETPNGTLIAVVETPDPQASPTPTETLVFPTESSGDFSISVLFPGPFREFTDQETINFDWFWPTVLEAGRHFAVYLIEGDQEYQLGSLTEPNNGAVYRLQVPGGEIPILGEDLVWQIRLESIDGAELFVASDLIPIIIRSAVLTPTLAGTGATITPTDTVTPTPTVACTIDPPAAWVLYTIREGDALAGLAQRANIPVEALLEVNCLPNDLLSIGQQVWVPQAAIPRTPTPGPTITSAPQPPRPISTSIGVTPLPPPPTDTPDDPTVVVPPTDVPTAPPPTATPPTPPTPTPPPG